jgi:hypothetical protein
MQPLSPAPRFIFHRAVALLGLTLSLSACDGRQPAAPDLEMSAAASAVAVRRAPEPPTLETSTPAYPVAVLYIVGREYVLKHRLARLDPADEQYLKYVERRLRQLYPEKGYDGMMEVAASKWRAYRAKWARYEAESKEFATAMYGEDGAICPMNFSTTCGGGGDPEYPGTDPGNTGDAGFEDDPSWTGNTEHPDPPPDFIPTIPEEIDTLQAEQPEIDRIYYYESLASGSYRMGEAPIHMTGVGGRKPVTIDDLIRLAGEGWTPTGGEMGTQGLGDLLVALPVVTGVLYYYYWRIETSGNRAEQRASQFFPGNQHNTRADAFRHTFLSMQLRRYVTSVFAKQITDEWEDRYSTHYAETRMDQHNNYLGRGAKYQYFRGHWLWDRWDWKEWAVRVRNYINDPGRGEFIPRWLQEPALTDQEIFNWEAGVPNWKYIYLNNG